MTLEQSRQLNYLAGCPSGTTTMTESDLQQVLLETGGNMLACGRLYNIKSLHLGVKVYRVSLELANP